MSENDAILATIYVAARAVVWTVITAGWLIVFTLDAGHAAWWESLLRLAGAAISGWVAGKHMRALRGVAEIVMRESQ